MVNSIFNLILNLTLKIPRLIGPSRAIYAVTIIPLTIYRKTQILMHRQFTSPPKHFSSNHYFNIGPHTFVNLTKLLGVLKEDLCNYQKLLFLLWNNILGSNFWVNSQVDNKRSHAHILYLMKSIIIRVERAWKIMI